jgi:outer membrane protein assembly factor BamB
VPRTEREQAKARIAALAADGFVGMLLTTAVTDNDRIITRTPRGNLFGYVQRDHELVAVRHDRWRIAWAIGVDGNVRAILEPAAEYTTG